VSAAVIEVDQDSRLPAIVEGCVLCIGKYDGVHQGHQALARAARELAGRLDTRSIAVTFDPLPQKILRPEIPLGPPLTPLYRKIQLLKRFGFDEVAVFRTGKWLLDLGARDFFERIILERFRAAGMAEGSDFSFGRNRSGDGRMLAEWCEAEDLAYAEVPAVITGGHPVTSSRIRKSLELGDLESVNLLLGHGLTTRGRVVRGAGRGRSISVPTANLSDVDTMLPGPGVYAAAARIIENDGSSTWRAAAVNVGTQPTFESDVNRVEAHLIGEADRDLYERQVELVWLKRVRETRKFSSIEALKTQLTNDIQSSMDAFASSLFLTTESAST
jgi:riboflavin kinase/FMN adenylyltransferase